MLIFESSSAVPVKVKAPSPVIPEPSTVPTIARSAPVPPVAATPVVLNVASASV